MDVLTHVPVLCEDAQVPYAFVPSKAELGAAGETKRPTSCVMIVPGGRKKADWDEYKKNYKEVHAAVKELDEQMA